MNILEFQALKAVESINRNDWIFFVVLHLKAGHSFSVFLRLAGVCVCLPERGEPGEVVSVMVMSSFPLLTPPQVKVSGEF